MHDAEALEALDRFGGKHGRAVVGEKGAWQRTFLKGLRQAVHEGLGGLVEIPLEMATEARAIVENAEQLRCLPLSRRSEYGTRALVKVQVPKAVHVSNLVRTGLARSERLAVALLAVAAFARAQQALLFHEAGDCRIAGDGPEAGVLARECEEIIVMGVESSIVDGLRCWRAMASARASPMLG